LTSHVPGSSFAGPDGREPSPEFVTKTFARLVALSGVRRQRLHDLRHLQAFLMLVAGGDIAVVSKRLGHS
jgi:integrase